ncbi:MAG: tetratricopeptide repeat protein [Myxococcota bacterium]
MIWLLFACGSLESESLYKAEQYSTHNTQILSTSVTGGLGWNYPQTSILPLEFHTEDEYIVKARALFTKGKDLDLIELLVPYVTQNPDHFVAHSMISASFFRLRDFEQSARAAQRVIELHPSGLTHLNYAITLQFLGYPERALEQYETALAYDKKSFLVLRNMASLHYILKNLPMSAYYLKELIRADPDDSYPYVALGQVLVEQKKYAEAEHIYRFRLKEVAIMNEQEQREAGGLLLDLPLALGRVCLLQGKGDAAKKWLKKTIELSSVQEGSWTSEHNYSLEAKRTLAGIALEEGQIHRAMELVTESREQLDTLLKENLIPNGEGTILRQQLLEMEQMVIEKSAEVPPQQPHQ